MNPLCRIYIGIDNGCTGSIGIMGDGLSPKFFKTPTKTEASYTKTVSRNITRIDLDEFCSSLVEYAGLDVMVLMERPMINPKRFQASLSARGALEATLIGLESLNFPYEYLDSKKWQKTMLGSGPKGSEQLKIASQSAGIRLFPDLREIIINHGDADGLLIAEYARRMNL